MGGVPSKPDPSKRLEVISTGYSRTGTASVQLALQKLMDGPVMHGGTHVLGGDDETMHKWLQAWQARNAGDKERCLKLLREVTTGFAGLVDMPCVAFLPELAELYPEAKFIIVTRDPVKWWASMEGHLKKALPRWMPYRMYSPNIILGDVLARAFGPEPGTQKTKSLTAAIPVTPIAPTLRWYPTFIRVWQADVDAIVGGRQNWGPQILTLHNEMARSLVPEERRLEYSIDEG